MQSSDMAALAQQVLWASFLISVVFGAIAQRTHFCTMGAISDVVNMGDWTRMGQWALAMGVAMLGVGALSYTGQIDLAKTLYASNRWLWFSALVGGLLFGFGMVLASGCGSKTLVRIGAGSLKSIVVFVVMGVAAFATLKGITAVVRVAYVDRFAVEMASDASLPGLLSALTGFTLRSVGLMSALVLGGGLSLWALTRRDFVSLANLVAGVGMGGLVIVMWWVSANGGYVAEHPETLQEVFLGTNSGKAEALSFVAPVAYALDWLMFFSDKSKVLTLGVASVVGVVFGSAVTALTSKTFRWEGFGGAEDVANHLVGATLMGIGGVTAMGCTVGQGLSGVSTLSASSFIAVMGILLGAVAAFRYQVWRVNLAD
jgi:uncharacterized membrane protein YedE/YeeE